MSKQQAQPIRELRVIRRNQIPTPPESKLSPAWTVGALARHWHLEPATIRAAIRRGELPARRLGRTWLLFEDDLEAWRHRQ